MLTTTDIPPGGEGKIEVTFNSEGKKGPQKKSVTVESNDSRNPRATLHVSANIEVVFGFEEYGLNLGKVKKGQTVSRTTSLVVKDKSVFNTIKLTSSSPFVTAKLLNSSPVDSGPISVEITTKEGLPVGRIDATITAQAGNPPTLQATLPLRGGVVGDIEITPEYMQFRVDTVKKDAPEPKQVIKVNAIEAGAQVHLLDIQDKDQRLKFKVDTLAAGKQYEISVTPRASVRTEKKNVGGTVTVKTDDKDQPIVSIPYSIYFAQ